MRSPLFVSLTLQDGTALAELPVFSATELQTDTGGVLHAVHAQGAAVLTRHRRPTFVVMTVDRYLELERLAASGQAQGPEGQR